MTDEQISEIYALGRDSFFGGQKSFQVQAYPFRMTPQNFAKHRNSPHMAFWKMLKRGNDHFEVSRLEPKVDFCEKRYVFDAAPRAGSTRPLSFSASGRCPVFEVPAEIANAVHDKQRRDEFQTAEHIRRGTPVVPVRTHADGGMHPVFVEAVKRNQIGVAPAPFSLASAPGTIPATVRPPRIPELANAPIMSGEAPAYQPANEANEAAVYVANNNGTQIPAQPAGKPANLFGSLFSSGSTAAAEKKSDSPIDRMARLMGLRGSDPEPAVAAVPAPKPKPKPAARGTRTAAHGAIRPRTDVPEPAKTAVASRAVPVPAAAPAAAPERAASPFPPPPAPIAAQTNNQEQMQTESAMKGSAPVVPAGSFSNRWSAFR
jgi:hypothetical protein